MNFGIKSLEIQYFNKALSSTSIPNPGAVGTLIIPLIISIGGLVSYSLSEFSV